MWNRLLLIAVFLCGGCSLLKERSASEPDPLQVVTKPLPPEKAQEAADRVAGNWFYGQGLGDAAITVGGVVAFPPYLVVVLGNAALSLTGYEPVTISGMLPEKEGKAWGSTYDAIAASPGRLSAAVAGKEYRTNEVIKDDMSRLLGENATNKKPHSDEPVLTMGPAAREQN